jgi:hypothetical protein
METTQKQYSTKNTTYTKANISNSNNITLTAKLTELNSKLTEMHGKDIDNTKLYNVIAQLSHISRETGRGFNFKV